MIGQDQILTNKQKSNLNSFSLGTSKNVARKEASRVPISINKGRRISQWESRNGTDRRYGLEHREGIEAKKLQESRSLQKGKKGALTGN